MNQTWENNKKTNFGPNFGVFGSNLGPKNFFASFTSSSSYHLMQFKGKLMNQTWENSKRPNFGPDFGLFGPNLGSQNFSCWFYLFCMLEIVASYYCMQFQEKPINKTWENGKNLDSGTILALKIFLVGFTSTRYYTLLQAIIVCNFKKN